MNIIKYYIMVTDDWKITEYSFSLSIPYFLKFLLKLKKEYIKKKELDSGH